MFPTGNVQKRFLERGFQAFERSVIDVDADGKVFERKVVRCVMTRPGARYLGENVVFGIAVTLERDVEGGATEQYTFLIPSHMRPRDRSRYRPHQGEREKARRR